jgi:hypothetical protein
MAPPGAMAPAELQSLRSFLRIASIIAMIVAIIAIILIAYYALVAAALGAFGFVVFGFGIIYAVIVLVVQILIWLNIREIRAMTDRGQYEAAKSKTLIWMVLGFIFGYIITGIFLLLAYLKFDPVINWQRMQGGGQVAPGPWMPQPQQPMGAMTPPSQSSVPPPQMAPAPGAAPICPKCGQPGTYVAQYNRYYCYTDQQYL